MAFIRNLVVAAAGVIIVASFSVIVGFFAHHRRVIIGAFRQHPRPLALEPSRQR